MCVGWTNNKDIFFVLVGSGGAGNCQTPTDIPPSNHTKGRRGHDAAALLLQRGIFTVAGERRAARDIFQKLKILHVCAHLHHVRNNDAFIRAE